jgi:IS5 family transposase
MRRTYTPESNLFERTDQLDRIKKLGSPLLRLNKAIKWESFRGKLEEVYPVEISKLGGRPRKDPLMMFKVLILQRLYNLSEHEMEYQLTDRASFMQFAGCKSIKDIPDENTIWLFKERMKEEGLIDQLFDGYVAGLQKAGLIVKEGVLVDATIVDAPRQRNSREENEQIKEGKTPEEWESKPAKNRQKDKDARWTKKHGKTFYGYKDHIKGDKKSKLILDYQVTTASEHDSQPLPELIGEDDRGQSIHADSAYVGPAIADHLKANGVENCIHEKGARNRPLTKKQKSQNTEKSRIRARVEHIFGQMTMQLKGISIRTIGLARASVQIGLMNLVYNMVRSEFIIRNQGISMSLQFVGR